MGNLEKLGILVIVILVVVVGVVAITPRERADVALFEPDPVAVPEPLDRLERDVRDWPLDPPPGPQERSTNVPAVQPEPAPGPAVLPDPVAPPVAPPPVAPAEPAFRLYTIRKDDSLYHIARRELGSPARYHEILAANPGLRPEALRPGAQIRIPTAAPEARTASAPADGAPAPAGPRTYVVKPGDSLSTIAAAELGTARRWKELYEANRDVVSSPESLRAGTTLRLPGTSAPAAAGSAPSAPSAVPSVAPSASADGTVYVVRPGDTLSKIAAAELGTSARWREILGANEDVLHGSTDLRPGMRLRIPGGVQAR